ncbi:MAG: hypothetical protein KDB05_21365 [Planctomycetales bacterium]|nr:hypothetical protein [Planctomycetales bacterium]
MKYKLPKVKAMKTRVNAAKEPPRWHCLLVIVVWNLTYSSLAFSQEAAESPESPSAVPAGVTGQEIVAQAAAQMTLHPSLEAKMRQRVGIRDQYMVGSGAYLQLRHGEDVRFRLELRLQVGEKLTSLQHITDSRYLYIRRDIGDTKSISRIDLKRVGAARSKLTPGNSPQSFASLGVGGLSQLLHGLADNFAFGDPDSETISGVNVWRMSGQWKPEVLASLLPDQSEAILAGQPLAAESLPPQLPDSVSLVVGRDGPLPLFPYRVEFDRRVAGNDRPRSMLIMELFEVRLRPDLDPRLFEVPDNEQDLVDETDVYLRKHGLAPAE